MNVTAVDVLDRHFARRALESRRFLGRLQCTWCRVHIAFSCAAVDTLPWLQGALRSRRADVPAQSRRRLDLRAAHRLQRLRRATPRALAKQRLRSIQSRSSDRVTDSLSPTPFA